MSHGGGGDSGDKLNTKMFQACRFHQKSHFAQCKDLFDAGNLHRIHRNYCFFFFVACVCSTGIAMMLGMMCDTSCSLSVNESCGTRKERNHFASYCCVVNYIFGWTEMMKLIYYKVTIITVFDGRMVDCWSKFIDNIHQTLLLFSSFDQFPLNSEVTIVVPSSMYKYWMCIIALWRRCCCCFCMLFDVMRPTSPAPIQALYLYVAVCFVCGIFVFVFSVLKTKAYIMVECFHVYTMVGSSLFRTRFFFNLRKRADSVVLD